MENYAKHEKDLIRKYEEAGYDHSYRFENGALIDSETGTAYTPREIYIVAEHRYEGMSNPSDLSILYVLETEDGNKGSLLMGYGPTANLELADFFKNIPKKNVSEKASLNT
ncbi:hypothetical protein [Ulvibacterium marinum]|uniref:Phosphoribosylpyrophosphate synthetase n=1 Tax=Ulvibacterium marinum TaxID=2419782 RepID=A0A3B0CI74_9FLAO|nr:hypothetical protein [Ulvibacterium marinum]RKN83696.1 hypothetical protein D7Z94_06480 [Ulvibacterium marinum]